MVILENPLEIAGLKIRYTEEGDAKYLRHWLDDPQVRRFFPMDEESEIEDSVGRWISFHRYKCSLTAELHGVPCGMVTLYLQPYRKLAHQCEFGIIVGSEFQNAKVGSSLISAGMHLAKERFNISLLHLTVYAENPAIRLYRRFGFQEFGRQNHFIKEKDGAFIPRIFMERFL